MAKREEVLVIVKVYPNISTKHGEIVCTAGITRDGRWLRLYPIPYRELPLEKRYKKFQWIKIDVEPSNEMLKRPESHKVVDINSLELLTGMKPGEAGWKEREKYFRLLIRKSLHELEDEKATNGTSLGIFAPKEVTDFVIEKDDTDWDEKKRGIMEQGKLFGIQNKPLEKIPYKFYYLYKCNDNRCTGHKMIVLDWEMAESYRNFKKTYKTEKETLEKIREKWLDYFFRQRESYFVVGTDSQFNKFMILTIISPRRRDPDTGTASLLT